MTDYLTKDERARIRVLNMRIQRDRDEKAAIMNRARQRRFKANKEGG